MTSPANRNLPDDDHEPDLGRLIDRLVDGELADAERRALLQRLDLESDARGWRRCALAFVEARDWREALSVPEPHPRAIADPGVITVATASTSRVGVSSPTRWLAMAATVALAFLLGRSAGPSIATGPTSATPGSAVPVAQNVTTTAPASKSAVPIEDDLLDLDEDWLALDGREPSNPWPAGTDYWRPSPSSTVRGGGTPWAWSNTPAPVEVPELPVPVVEDWRRRGFEVETRPRVVSVATEESRPVPIPVNEVRVRYVGDRTY